MESEELRIANLVRDVKNKNIIVVNSISGFGINHNFDTDTDEFEWEDIEGIPIDEKWLLAFGFEPTLEMPADEDAEWEYNIIEGPGCYNEFRIEYNSCQMTLRESAKADGWDVMEIGDCFISHIHQLQNFFYMLNREDIKNLKYELISPS